MQRLVNPPEQEPVALAPALVENHPAVIRVRFAGSRSRGTHEELSDWDFAVEASDFDAIARDLPTLIAPLEPLAWQWEPLGHFPVYQVMLRGPTKVEYLFLRESQDPAEPVNPTGYTSLAAINTHFWDWIWWLATKAATGRHSLVSEHLPQLYDHLLRPIGVDAVPKDVDSAIRAFVARRDALEREYGAAVPRALEDEVLTGIDRIHHST